MGEKGDSRVYYAIDIQTNRSTGQVLRDGIFKGESTAKSSTILGRIAKSTHPLSKLAGKLLDYVKYNDVDITIEDRDNTITTKDGSSFSVAGAYYSDTNSITLFENAKYPESRLIGLILHEILHSLSYHQIRKATIAGKDFSKLLAHAKKHLPDQYALRNTDEDVIREGIKRYQKDSKLNKAENKFLQLLNKDGNWVKFFVQSIVADSKKKGYKNILFPAGETAARIEGHETLTDSILRDKERIEKLDKEYEEFKDSDYLARRYGDVFFKQEQSENLYIVDGDKVSREEYFKRIKGLQESQRVILEKSIADTKSQGIEKLKPIEGFYEVRVQNTLKKLYPDNVVRITDEYGNDWFSVNLYDQRTGQVLFEKAFTNDDD